MNNFLNKLSSKILFNAKLQSIPNKNIRNYLSLFLNLKVILLKVFVLLLQCFICATLFFILREWSLNNVSSMNVVFNSGAAFGFGNDWNQSVVYFIKAVPTIIFFFIFLLSNKLIVYAPSCLVFLNSLFILIDKSLVDNVVVNSLTIQTYYNTVVDYFDFKIFVNNIGDIFISIGTLCLVVSIIYLIITEWKKGMDENEQNRIDS